MPLSPQDITIAVTVFSRREFVCQAIQSALDQTIPVKVIVVEDCSPDPSLREFILGRFDGRIQYFRNSRNRGLFDNWNACIENCRSLWLSILHDDDFLHPHFVKTILQLATEMPDCGLYFGRSSILGEDSHVTSPGLVDWDNGRREINLIEFADRCFVHFPGQLFNVMAAKYIGGVRPNSYLTGDWDFWLRLAFHFRSAQSATEVSVVRSHYGADRGTSRVERKGWKWVLDNVQRKRNFALLKNSKGIVVPFDRLKWLKESPIPCRQFLLHSRRYSRRILLYNWWLFIHSLPPNPGYRALQSVARISGPGVLPFLSLLFNPSQKASIARRKSMASPNMHAPDS